MRKHTPFKLLSLLVALCLLLTSLPGSAVGVRAVNTEAAEPAAFRLDADCQILDYVHADVFNQNDHISRLKDEETLDTYVFLNRDGTKTVYYMNRAVKFRDPSGTVREKNIDLTADLTGYSTTQNDIGLHIPNDITGGVRLSYAGYNVSILPQGGSTRLSPQRNGNSVAYPNYFGSGTALVYTPTLDGVKEDILLAQYNGVSDFSFLLNTDGLNLYHTPEDRYYLAQTESAEMKIWLGNIEIFDAEARPGMGTLTAETVTPGQQYRLTVHADVDFLTDPDTVYPVTIDPTITVSDNTYGANAIEDAPIYSGYPTSNFGTYQYNRAGYAGSAYGRGRTVVRLNGLLSHSAFTNASEYNISSVIFYTAEASGTAAKTVNLYPLTGSAWTETGITWNNCGSTGPLYATNTLSYNGYASFNITALARLWKNGTYSGSNGFILIGASETSEDKSMYSSEHSTSSMRPYVVATYNSNLNSVYYPAPYINHTESTDNSEFYFDYGTVIIRDNLLQLRANCYGYALRLFYDGEISEANDAAYSIDGTNCVFEYDSGFSTASFYGQQPGEFADKAGGLTITVTENVTDSDGVTHSKNYSYTFYTNADLLDYKKDLYNVQKATDDVVIDFKAKLVEADAEALGFACEILPEGSAIPDADVLASQGMRLIALVLKNGKYHFYMQHSDNSWSHKNHANSPSSSCLNGCGALSSNSVFAAHALEGDWKDGEIRYIKIGKSAALDCSHNNGGDAVKTTLCHAYNARAVGDTMGSAMPLGTALPIQYSGYMDCGADIDFFNLSPGTSKTATFNVSSSSADLIVTLYDSGGNILYGPTSPSHTVSFTRYLASGTGYYLSITSANSDEHAIHAYSLRIS